MPIPPGSGVALKTELARVQTQAQKLAFEQNGFEEYLFIMNGSGCEHCSNLNGKHFKVSEMEIGKNAPPMHPNCRCSIAAYEDSAEYDEWIEHLANGGTTESWQKQKAVEKEEQDYQSWLKKINAQNSAPETLEKYYQERYNNTPAYQLLKKYAKDVESGWVSPNVGFTKYKEVHQFIEENIVGKKTSNGILIKGQSDHFIQRVCGTMVDPEKLEKELKIIRRSGIEIEDALEALTNGTARPVKYIHGKPSQVFFTDKCVVSINPDTGILIQCNQ